MYPDPIAKAPPSLKEHIKETTSTEQLLADRLATLQKLLAALQARLLSLENRFAAAHAPSSQQGAVGAAVQTCRCQACGAVLTVDDLDAFKAMVESPILKAVNSGAHSTEISAAHSTEISDE
jgi:hypothetical protein